MRYSGSVMKNKKSKSASATAVAAITKNEFGLTVVQMEIAVKLQGACPAVVEAVKQVSEFEAGLKDKYFSLCRSIREARLPLEAGAVRGLNRSEVTLLLQSLGYTKQRITEINRVVEVPAEIWAKFETKEMGFRATLALARSKPGEQLENEAGAEVPSKLKKEIKLSKAMQDVLIECSNRLIALKIKTTKGDEGYQFVHEGTAFRVTANIFVDEMPATNQ